MRKEMTRLFFLFPFFVFCYIFPWFFTVSGEKLVKNFIFENIEKVITC